MAVLLSAALGLPLLATVPAVADSPAQPTALRQKADGAVRQHLASDDRATFWVRLDSEADTSDARKAKSKTAKGRAVYRDKTAHADQTQAGLKALLKKAGAHYSSYWVTNTIKVTGADKALAAKIAARPEVAALEADTPLTLPDELPATEQPTVDGVEWGVDRINAPKVWDELGDRGDGVVVASIDTGVDYLHPALANNYRGRKADGTYQHAYNWYDATATCPGDGPCDDHGHGTHTMGTMAGAGGIGVAPGATWMAAKACTTTNCPREALLAAGQWILAPTDADGQNPRPDLAPDIVNNSWGADVIDTWYKDLVQAWQDAGIFPAFSNGNAGPDCATAGSPGAYTNSYASGAFDSDGDIAYFSSRGSGEDGAVKPDIAAPGVDIRSAAPGGGYAVMSGTSMASPHTAATVALLWSASPALRGDVALTEQLLDRTAHDTEDTTCGGTAGNNNVWGEGKLDAYAALSGAPRGPLGALAGTVTADGQPLAGATVELDGPMQATVTTKDDGTYALPKVMVGDYDVTVSKFGYVTATATATVTEGGTTTRDIDVKTAPIGTLSGTVRTASGPEAGATIAITGTTKTATTGSDGGYSIELPSGKHELRVTPVNRCATVGSFAVDLAAGGTVRDLTLPSRSDKFGTTCRTGQETPADYPTGSKKLTYSSPYSGGATISLPFPVALYGKTYRKVVADVEGYLNFGIYGDSSENRALPTIATPNATLYPFWDNLQLSSAGGAVYWAERGTAPHREVVVEWRDMVTSSSLTHHLGFSVVIGEDGTYAYHYSGIDSSAVERGSGATIGAENADGTDALQYAYNAASISDGTVLTFEPGRSAAVSGAVTDANDGKAVADATVTVTRDGEQIATGSTASDGTYLVQTPVTGDAADYQVAVSAAHYRTDTRTATLESGTATRTVTALQTGNVSVAPSTAMTVVVQADESRERTVTLANSGADTAYTVKEASGAGWLRATPADGTLATDATRSVTLTFDTTGVPPGTVLTGTVVVASDSGRAPELKIPVTVSVPGYRQALNAGSGSGTVTDAAHDTWGPDRAYTEGAYGYVGQSSAQSTRKTVAGTDEQALFSTARQGALEYRFDDVPDGVYQVDLDFAELGGTNTGQRVFDVMAEGTTRIDNLDIAKEAGTFTALTKTFTVTVTDGQLNLRLVAQTGKTLVNAVRVTHRPDLKS
ncbi:S8 family serine peptidase [Streptomyces sp. VRA16 Mangrove soil]|nr:S8 family serine peptidase [Streptomyces sp. VRA16 Mangrove soil]